MEKKSLFLVVLAFHYKGDSVFVQVYPWHQTMCHWLVPVPEGWNPSIADLSCSNKQTNTKQWVLKLPCQNISATSSSFSLDFSSWHLGVVPGYYLRPSSLLHTGLLHIGFLIIMLIQFKTSHGRQHKIAFIQLSYCPNFHKKTNKMLNIAPMPCFFWSVCCDMQSSPPPIFINATNYHRQISLH